MTRNTSTVKTKEMFQRDLSIGRSNLLLAAVFTLVNIIFVLTNADWFFFFTLSIPVYLTMLFSELCGMRPDAFYDEVYPEIYGENWQNEVQFLDSSIFWAVVVVSIVITAAFFALWFFSKKSRAVSIVNLVVYIVDAFGFLIFAFFFYGFSVTALLELLFHVWLLYYAVLAVKAWNGIKTAPTAAEVAASMGYGPASYGAPSGNATVFEGTAEEVFDGSAEPMDVESVKAVDAPAEDVPAEDVSAEDVPVEETSHEAADDTDKDLPQDEEPKAE